MEKQLNYKNIYNKLKKSHIKTHADKVRGTVTLLNAFIITQRINELTFRLNSYQ